MRKLIVLLIIMLLVVGCTKIDTKKDVIENNVENINQGVEENIIKGPDEMEECNLPIEVDIDSFDSINVIINKERHLPEDYKPSDLVVPDVPLMKEIYMRKEAAEAIKKMFDAASADGIELKIGSGFRSYNYQKKLFNNYVERDGEEAANKYSAKPGQSEHQTGLAADIANKSGYCYLKNCFKDTNEGIWLKENAYKYGFILRFMEGKEEITGYIFEPWHYRYVGIDEAIKIHESGKTLEEYYGIIDK